MENAERATEMRFPAGAADILYRIGHDYSNGVTMTKRGASMPGMVKGNTGARLLRLASGNTLKLFDNTADFGKVMEPGGRNTGLGTEKYFTEAGPGTAKQATRSCSLGSRQRVFLQKCWTLGG
jgi:hypothetical protein